jgi:metallo-beta-lactamase class B
MSRKPALRHFALAIALIPALAPHVPAQQPDPAALAKDPGLFVTSAAKTLKWNEVAEPTRIIGPIHFVGTKGLGAFLITTSEGHVLLNTGMPGSGRMIEASIRKLGFKPEDVRLLLANHAHVDHVGGHAYVRKISGARVAMMEAEVPLLESGAKTDFHYAKSPDFAFEPVKVDWVLHDGDTIKLGDVAITALHTPGHTKGSTTFTMNVVDGGKAYAVAFPNGASVNPGYRLVRDPSYPGIADDYRRTLHVFETLKPDVWLMPHNEAYGFEAKRARADREGARAWVDPDGYREWAAAQRDRVEAATKREVGAAAAAPAELLRPKATGAK